MPGAARQHADHVLDSLLSRRLIFVAGKGGTGKTTIAAALCVLGARRGKRVLGIEVDAKGDLAQALGAAPVGFEAKLVQSRVSVLALHPEDALREYLKVFFKVPKLVGITPLSRVFDFVATSVPGPKDMLIIGKIAYEERLAKGEGTKAGGGPKWDLIVVDCTATGHAMAQILAAREMRKLTRGGMIRGQLEWIDYVLTDAERSAMVITALPQEMPVAEALELYERARREKYLAVAACFLNRMPPPPLPAASRRVLDALGRGDHTAVDAHLGGSIATVADGVRLAETLHTTAAAQLRHLREGTSLPIVTVPLVAARPGLATTRAVAAAIEEGDH